MLKVINGGIVPTKGSKYSAAIDLYANEDVVIGAGETAIVGLGVCIDIVKLIASSRYANLKLKHVSTNKDDENFLKSHYLQLEPRSSLRAKGLQAGTGVIDLDYEDEIKIILHKPIDVHQSKFMIDAGFLGLNCGLKGLDFDREMDKFKEKNKDVIFSSTYKIKKGDKIAQIMLKEHKSYLFGIDTEEERVGGFGSTNKDNK